MWYKTEYWFDVVVKVLFYGFIGGMFLLSLACQLISPNGFSIGGSEIDGLTLGGTLLFGFILMFHFYRFFWVKFCFLLALAYGLFSLSVDAFIGAVILCLVLSAVIELISLTWQWFATAYLGARYGVTGSVAFIAVNKFLNSQRRN